MLTALSGMLTYDAIVNGTNRMNLILHTNKVLDYSSELGILLRDVEINQIGYLQTLDTLYVKLNKDVQTKIFVTLDSIKNFISGDDYPSQLLNSQIQPLINERFIEINNMSSIVNFNDATLRKDIGLSRKKFMDSLSMLMNQFTSEEQTLLSQRLAKIDKAHRFHNNFRFISFFLIGVTSFLALLTILQKNKKNDELIEQLRQSNLLLEAKVKDRTRELQDKNDQAKILNKKLEQTLEEVQAFYDALQIKHERTTDTFNEIRDLYDNAPCGYHSVNKEGTIVRMNNRELSWLGYSREEVIDKLTLKDIIIPEELQWLQENFSDFLRDGKIQNREYHFQRKDKSTFPVLINATSVYDEQGNYMMSRGVVIDITDIKRIEEQLLETNKKLVKLNEDKSEILGIAAHDLKSPLNGIIGLINLMKPTAINFTGQQQEYLRYIEQSCINMSTLINNLLDINRIEQGLNVVTPQKVELDGLLQSSMKIFKEQADKRNITLILENNAPSVSLMIDPIALNRILENLLSNAIKFSPHHKEILIRVTNHGAHVRLEVKDQGPGITKEDMPELFKKYKRLSARPTGGESSTGLGLSIVKELVNCLQGKISVESRQNDGTTFILEFPTVS